MDIAVDPPQFESSVYRTNDICLVCGCATTTHGLRLPVTIYPHFSNDFSCGLGGWAHEECFAACEEVWSRTDSVVTTRANSTLTRR